MNLNDKLKAELFQLGFQAVGLTTPLPTAHLQTYRSWLEKGFHGEMAYLSSAQAVERRADPSLILPGAGTVVTAALPYADPSSAPPPTSTAPHGRVAAYAWGADYHDVIPARLHAAVERLQPLFAGLASVRAYTDTGPILERDLAQRAGLGWIGKNTCLIIPGQGSSFLLGELFIQAELEPDPAFEADRCGSCRRCIDACPTGCIQEDRTLDARSCISYLTIENKKEIPAGLRPKLGEWVFGCDICQQVCPWNQRFSQNKPDPLLQPRPEVARPDLLHELALTPETFNLKFRGSPVKRAKRRGYLRNVAVALGNSGQPEAVAPLKNCLGSEPEVLVRAHAAWALGRLGTTSALDALEQAVKQEISSEVRAEILAALQESGTI